MFKNLLPGVPLVESPFFNEFAGDIWSGEILRIANDINKNGFAVFKLDDPELIKSMHNIRVDFRDKYDWEGWKSGKLDSLRLQDAWQTDQRVLKIASNKQIISVLSSIYGRTAFPFQTLNFAVSSEQRGHSDHVHFSSLPERFMCGVWVAFEDVDEDNGPLFYYPGSHKWPSFANEHIGVSGFNIGSAYGHYNKYVELWEALAKTNGIKKSYFHAKSGDALIWSSNLVHGGTKMIDRTRTRWSQVTHYFFEGCGYTTPVANDINQGQIYYRQITDISTNRLVKNIISGFEVDPELIKILTPPCISGIGLPQDFNAKIYLNLNPDVLQAGTDPITHYLNFGRIEGRKYK